MCQKCLHWDNLSLDKSVPMPYIIRTFAGRFTALLTLHLRGITMQKSPPSFCRASAAAQIKFARRQLKLARQPDIPTLRAFLRGMIVGVSNVTFNRIHFWSGRSWWTRP